MADRLEGSDEDVARSGGEAPCGRCGQAMTCEGDEIVCRPCMIRVLLEGTRRGTMPPEAEAAAKDPGNVVGRYVKLRELGRGGFGAVWLAWDGQLSRHVALKFLKAQFPDDIPRFRREATLAASLSHPNIAAVYEVLDEPPCIAMQYVEGRTADKAAPDAREAARIVTEAAEAVHAAHARGIIHRDLKPQNIMVDPSGRVYVMDFGLAKRTDVESSLSQSGLVVGTPVFMSPEQAEGHVHLGPAADVYSLGATLYALVEGRPPFVGSTIDVLRQVTGDEPAPPHAERDLCTIILKALEKDPARRYAGAKELADDLGRYLAGDAILAAPASALYRLRKRVRKNPWLYAVGALGLAGILATAAILVPMWSKARTKQAETARAMDLWQKISGLMTDGELYARYGDVKRARAKWDEGIAICRDYLEKSEFPHARYFLGRLLHERGDRDGALRELDRAIELDASLGEARHERGLLRVAEYRTRMWAYRSAATAARAETNPGYRPTIAELEKLHPVLTRMKAAAGDDLSVGVGASSFFRKIDGLYGRALLCLVRGEAEEGRTILSQVLSEDPTHARAVASLARLASEGGLFDDAVTLATRAIDVHRGFGEAYLIRSEALRSKFATLPFSESAIALLRRSLEDAEAAAAQGEETEEALQARGNTLTQLALGEVLVGNDPRPYLTRAIDDFGRAIERGGRVADYFTNRGNAHTRLGEALADRAKKPDGAFAKAVEDYDAAISINPGLEIPFNNRGYARTRWSRSEEARGADPRPRLRLAMEDFMRALERSPSYTMAMDNLGNAYLYVGMADAARGIDPGDSYAKAVNEYDLALAATPPLAQALKDRGLARLAQAVWAERHGGDACDAYQKAIDDFGRAQDALGKEASLYSNRANAYAGLGRARALKNESPLEAYQQSIEEFGYALGLNPNSPVTLGDRANALVNLAEMQEAGGVDPFPAYQAALEDHRNSIALRPDSPEGENNLGYAYHSLARAQERARRDPRDAIMKAVEHFGRSIELNGAYADAPINRGNAHRHLGELEARAGGDPGPYFQKSIEDFDKAIQVNPSAFEAYNNRGITYCILGERAAKGGQESRTFFMKAIESFDAAAKLNRASFSVLKNRAYARFNLQDFRGAAQDWQHAIDLNPSLEPALRPWIKRCGEVPADDY